LPVRCAERESFLANWIRTIIGLLPFRRGGAQTPSAPKLRIRAIIFEEDDWWCAQCLEYDIAAQARSLSDLQSELVRVLETHMIASVELGQAPFEGLPPAPKKFWQMYKTAAVSEDGTKQLIRPEDLGSIAPSHPLPFVVSTFKVASPVY
jgi:hypothetical protein